jgi:hypothetical protein
MRLLFLIPSCGLYQGNGFATAVRETWLKTWGHLVDYRFALGNGCVAMHKDELVVDAPDGYEGISYKCQAAYRWAWENGYDFVFQCFVDTYAVVPRLLASGFENHECFGAICDPVPAPGGGAGYFLGPSALLAVVSAVPPFPTGDDLNVGLILKQAGLPLKHDPRFWTDIHVDNGMVQGGYKSFRYQDEDAWDSGVWTVNLGIGCKSPGLLAAAREYDSAWMFECHKSFLASEVRK